MFTETRCHSIRLGVPRRFWLRGAVVIPNLYAVVTIVVPKLWAVVSVVVTVNSYHLRLIIGD
jgi:hypothetical protein